MAAIPMALIQAQAAAAVPANGPGTGIHAPVPAGAGITINNNTNTTATSTSASHPVSQSHFLTHLQCYDDLDVWDIHELGWRRALIISSRKYSNSAVIIKQKEYLIRYIGWDSKWDEWIRPDSNRLAPAQSKTSINSDTGYKGNKSSEESLTIQLARDWNSCRKQGLQCDIYLIPVPNVATLTNRNSFTQYIKSASATNSPCIRPNSVHHTPINGPINGNTNISQYSTPSLAPLDSLTLDESKEDILAATSNTADDNIARILSARIPFDRNNPAVNLLNNGSINSGGVGLFPAHKFFIKLRCPELLRAAPSGNGLNFNTIINDSNESSQQQQQQQQQQQEILIENSPNQLQSHQPPLTSLSLLSGSITTAATATAMLDDSIESTNNKFNRNNRLDSTNTSSTATNNYPIDNDERKAKRQHSADISMSNNNNTNLPAVSIPSINSTTSSACVSLLNSPEVLPLDAEQFDELTLNNSNLSLSASAAAAAGISPNAPIIPIHGVSNSNCLAALLDYLYTGDVSMGSFTTVTDIFDLNNAAAEYSIDRLQSLCALSLNRYLTVDNIFPALQLAVKHNLDNDRPAISAAATNNNQMHSTAVTSQLLKVCLEFLVSHWELIFTIDSNLRIYQSLDYTVFTAITQWIPLRNITTSAFIGTYPIVHPIPCNLLSIFKQLYENRSNSIDSASNNTSNCDFNIIIGDTTFPVHKAVLVCRSEYFRALFRSGMSESIAIDNNLLMDINQFSVSALESLIKYLYTGECIVNSDSALYLGDCSNYFGLANNLLELAAIELISQEHSVTVVRNAFKQQNYELFRRACRFIDWKTLAQLMQPQPQSQQTNNQLNESQSESLSGSGSVSVSQSQSQHSSPQLNSSHHSPILTRSQAAAASASAAAGSGSGVGILLDSPQLTAAPAPSPAPLINGISAFDISLWQAIVSEKSNPSLANNNYCNKSRKSTMKRNRGVAF